MLFNKKFGKVLPFSLISMTFSLFISQIIFKTFLVGILFDLLICLGFIVLLFTKKRDRLKGNFFTSGLFSFLLIFIFYYIIDFDRILGICDELTHWGPFVKEMMRLDKFYYIDESFVQLHKNYPPFVSLFELLWGKISCYYSDMNISIAYNVLMLSVCIPYITELLKEKNKYYKALKTILITIGIIAILISCGGVAEGGIFNTIYVDYLLSFLFALGIIIILSDNLFSDRYTYILLLCVSAALVLSKEIGILFYALLVIFYALRFIRNIKRIEKSKRIKEIFKLVSLIILPLIPLLIWKNCISGYSIAKRFDYSSMQLTDIINVFTRYNLPGNQSSFIFLYLNKLINGQLTGFNFTISYASITAIILAGLTGLLIYKKIYKKDNIAANKILFTLFMFVISNVIYILILYFAYIFFFNADEQSYVACFERYITTIIIPELIVCIFIGLKYIKPIKHISNILLTITTIIVILLLLSSNIYLLSRENLSKNDYQNIKDIAEIINSESEKENILVVEHSHWDCSIFLHYYLDLNSINIIKISEITEQILKNFQFVIVIETENETFLNNFEGLVEKIIYELPDNYNSNILFNYLYKIK